MTASTLVPFALLGTGEGVKQTLAIEGSPHSFAAEGHRAFGGTDSAPSPLDFALGALTSCTQVTGQIVARGNPKIALGRWEVAVKANLDGAVLLNGGEGCPISGMSTSRCPWRPISTTALSLNSPRRSNIAAR
jgi:putative redox protein